ncbi:MAG: tetratricopeptide repeat protein, partial [Myxococcota bacterium]
RNQALKALDGRVAQGSRLVTVHGAGGLGKSRLAVEWARTRAHAWPGGVYFCGLADVHDRQGLCVAIAQVLEVKLDRDEPTALLGRVLAARGRAMVVLDNVEQIVELTTDCLSMWLEQSPETLFMVTSRTRLGLTAEVVYSLGPLELPSDTAPEIESEAVALFIDRATIARPSFSPTPATRAEIAQLVAELDGLPLAIELAAARCGLLSPGAILARLDQRFRLLRSKHRDISPRQATLKATLDWSWDLLEPHERDAMTQCAVFAGSFSLEAAEAIIALDPTHDDLPWVIDLLEALTDKSLLSPAEDNRFTTFASVRAYAEAILDQTHDGTAVVKRAVAYFSAYGNPVFLDRLEQSRSALQELQAELDNVGLALRKACAYAMPEEAGLCALALGGYFLSQGPYSEGIHRVEQALKHTGASPQVRLRLHLCAGQLATAGTDLEQATAHLSKAFELSRNHDDVAHAASAHCFYGDVLQLQGRRDNARTHYQAGLELARAIDDPKRQALAHQGLGSVLAYQETWDRALEHFNVGLALARTLRHTKLEANLHIRLGQSAVTQGRRKLALDHLNNGLKLAHRIGDTRLACDARHATARALPRSEAEQIRSYYQINLELARSLGWRKREADALFGLGDLDMEQHRLDSAHARYTSVLALARTLGLERNEVTALIRIGSVQLSRGHVNEAQTRFEEALAVARSFENPITEMLALGHLGSAAMEAANADQAKQAFDDALTLSKTLSNDYVGAWILYDLGRVALLQGHTDTVEHYLTEADRFPGACDELARSGRMAWALFELRRNRPTHALCTLATDTLMHSEDPAVALMTRLEFTALMALAHASQGQHTEAERFRQQVRDHLEALTLPPYARLAVLAKQALHEG